MRSEILKDHFD